MLFRNYYDLVIGVFIWKNELLNDSAENLQPTSETATHLFENSRKKISQLDSVEAYNRHL